MFKINFLGFEELEKALAEYSGNTEEAINEVLHSEEINTLAQNAIKTLMPRSNKKKGRHAKDSNSLGKLDGNLSLTVRATKAFQYLYFADDGTNTRRHIGDQRFFERGGEEVQGDIVQRCIDKLTTI